MQPASLQMQDVTFIFADSFGHEDYVIEAAKEYPDSPVQPCNRNQGSYRGSGQLSTMHSLLSMTDVILLVSQQV